jgi:integrase
MIRLIMGYAVEQGWRDTNPALGIKPSRQAAGGFHTWTETEIGKFEDAHALGTRARLALALLLHTAQRRGDVIHMGPQHIRNGVLKISQQKTGAVVEIPVAPELRAAIDAVAGTHLNFPVTEFGKPFTPAGFTNWFKDVCKEAGLPKECCPHGLKESRRATVGRGWLYAPRDYGHHRP